jgi:cell shape-determining protein MreD
MHALAFTVISIIVIKLHESINKRRLFMVSLCTLILNFIFYTIFIFYYFIFAVDMTRIAAGFFVSVFYNSFLTIILIYFFLFINRLKLSIDV